jgi:hypothetical protein
MTLRKNQNFEENFSKKVGAGFFIFSGEKI